jgi:3-hydroxyacyl-CoA dehydrogenase
VRDGVAARMREAAADSAAKAVVLICAGRTFFAGADITEFGKPPKGIPLGELVTLIEDMPKPVVAAIHGTALGGGLEMALGCHYRVAVPSARVGLPEVKLGILPGAGGTQRLPRIVGVERALEMITSGEHVPAPKAKEAGLVDELAPEDGLREAALAFAKRLVAEGKGPRKVRDLSDKVEAAGGNPADLFRFRQGECAKIPRLRAPAACIEAVKAAVELPFEQGIAKERELFLKLVSGTQSKGTALRVLRRARSPQDPGPPGRHADAARQLGRHPRRRHDGRRHRHELPQCRHPGDHRRDEAGGARPRALHHPQELRGDRRQGPAQAGGGRQAHVPDQGTLDFEALSKPDLIIEAVFEDMAIKKDVFSRLDKVAKPGAILASNTSYLDVDEIGSVTSRPESVIGMHFFSPANVMKLLEVVRAERLRSRSSPPP